MTLLIISVPLMVLGLAAATVPIIVAMIGEQNERDRGEANSATRIANTPNHDPAVTGPNLIGAEQVVVRPGPGARLSDETAA
jgi:hypothetical protein